MADKLQIFIKIQTQRYQGDIIKESEGNVFAGIQICIDVAWGGQDR